MLSHQYTLEDLYALLQSDVTGLTHAQARERLLRNGRNEIAEGERVGIFKMFIGQFADFMIVVLIVAAIISAFLGDAIDAYVIIGIVVINALIGLFQEYRAERAMEALKRMATPFARVCRESKVQEIPSAELVVGDVVLLEAGNVVPADIRLTESHNLRCDEAALTGESQTVEKKLDELREEYLPLGDRTNMLFKGTSVTNGSAHGLVVATAMETELGKIARLLQDEGNVKTPLQRRLAEFGRRLAYGILVICAIIFVIGIIRGEEVIVMLLTAISLAVAAIPEALPAVVTIALSISATRMVKKNALIRRLPAVETLGSVTYICSDKTGTLTKQQMHVRCVYLNGKEVPISELREQVSIDKTAERFCQAMGLNSDVSVAKDGTLIGEPTEIALARYAAQLGSERLRLESSLPRVGEIPFDSVRKCMTTLHCEAGGEIRVMCKGAPDVLVNLCTHTLMNGQPTPIDRNQLNDEFNRIAEQGMRVLAFCTKVIDTLPDQIDAKTIEQSMQFLGFVGMIDPPREEAKEAVLRCKLAKIIPVMITGDHPLTARVIAQELGILEGQKDEVVSSVELERMSHDELLERVENIRVYARVAPEQKLRIVKALQERGQYVAMTGDGVNDAPALKRADIGVAMGINGTDVSKEAASMILLDDNFASIVNAVSEGRRVYDNIRKFIKYVMTSNSGEIWTIFLAPFFGLPIPLLPVHILWINLVTDGLPGLALAAEPPESDVMSRPPRHPKESIFSRGLGIHIIWVGLLMGFVPIATQALAIRLHDTHWQTMVFTVLCLSQMGHVMAIRSESASIFRIGIFSNKALTGAFILTLLLQLMTIYVPFFQSIFRTQALTLVELVIALAASSIVFIAVEVEKFVRRRALARRVP